VMVPARWVARCVHCYEEVAWRNMLRKYWEYWISINYRLLHLVGIAFIYYSKTHGHPGIKCYGWTRDKQKK
jgi:hypothetical protein